MFKLTGTSHKEIFVNIDQPEKLFEKKVKKSREI